MAETDLRVVDATPLRYLLSVPSAPAPEAGAWPVLCFLHGHGEAAPLDIRRGLTRHGPLRQESARVANERFIMVAPQLPRSGDIWREYAAAVRRIVMEVQDAHRGDPHRTYLTGFSFGGNGVFDLSVVQRNVWAALWAVDPTRVPGEDLQRPIWLSFGEVSRRRKDESIRAMDLKPGGSAADGDCLYLDQGKDHAGSATFAYQDGRIYDWLLAQRLTDSV